MDLKVQFFFYLAAFICFVLGALGNRAPAMSSIGLVPLGLALFVFPLVWNTAEAAF
ncbi:MAG TPA: hypothetical protein VM264_09555 [Acidimicrobiales bacterium]|jgi:hypothetical protein|nr:hypothetical protein [Acidimicrobiales bacterium]